MGPGDRSGRRFDRAGEQRGVELERRVLGGGAHQNDGAILHHRQKAVLLGAVEAVDLVDEEQRAPSGRPPGAGRLELREGRDGDGALDRDQADDIPQTYWKLFSW